MSGTTLSSFEFRQVLAGLFKTSAFGLAAFYSTLRTLQMLMHGKPFLIPIMLGRHLRFVFSLGAPVAQLVKRRPADLAVPGSSPA